MKYVSICLLCVLFSTSCSTTLIVINESDRTIAKVSRNGEYNFDGKETKEKAVPGGFFYINGHGDIELEIKIDDYMGKVKMREAFNILLPRLPKEARISVVSITAPVPIIGDFLIDELTSLLVNENKFVIVDRKSLDAIRYEQYFQMSGDVDDKTAVSIGKLLGVDFIITGLSRDDNSLMLKAINVETAQILAMVNI